jgi:arginine:ornithine antiporter/lysine permease
MILRGVQQAAAINSIVTIAKIVPILVFIVILIGALNAGLFGANFWGGEGMPDASLFDQVRATMLVTVFVFLGIEGASVYSRYAKKRSDVGAATIAGFIGVTTLMVLASMLPYAVLPRAEIAGMRQPSMAAVLEAVVGPWGAIFVSAGLVVSVLGAYLAWSLIAAEVLFTAAKTKDMPRLFASENQNKVPAAALWLTNVIVQLFVISTYWSQDAFSLMLNMTSAMTLIPYLLTAAFGVQIARRGEGYETVPGERSRDLRISAVAMLYTAFMLLAGGTKFLLLSAILYAPGTALYFWARREQEQKAFTRVESIIFLVAVLGAIVGIHGLATGYITI